MIRVTLMKGAKHFGTGRIGMCTDAMRLVGQLVDHGYDVCLAHETDAMHPLQAEQRQLFRETCAAVLA